MAPTSRGTQWVAEEFDRRAATYDGSEMHHRSRAWSDARRYGGFREAAVAEVTVSRDYCAGGKTSEWEPPSTCRTVPVVAPASGLAR
jgi:hypothetical protein